MPRRILVGLALLMFLTVSVSYAITPRSNQNLKGYLPLINKSSQFPQPTVTAAPGPTIEPSTTAVP